MADDSLATPINKLPSVSTRDAPKSVSGDVSYADILKQQEMERHQFDQQQSTQDQLAPVQPQFQEPMMQKQEYMQDPRAGGYPYAPDTGGYPPHPGYQPPVPPPAEPAAPEQQPPPKKWWRLWIFENKTGWIVAFVTFIVLTFVYPRIRSMARFQGLPLPYWATGSMSVLGATLVTAIDMSI
jgi:hypothetical protein